MIFHVGDRVKKIGGNYQATGWVVGAFTTRAGAERYVFEFEDLPGMLHIFSTNQLAFHGPLEDTDLHD